MRQKLTDIISGSPFTWKVIPRVRTKVEVRREASKKAWRSRKRVAAARALAQSSDATRQASNDTDTNP
jgi:hypothetical protein